MVTIWIPSLIYCFILLSEIQFCNCEEEEEEEEEVLYPCNKTVLIYAPDELEEIEYVTVIDILRRAKINITEAGEFMNFENIITEQGINLIPDISLKELYKFKPNTIPFDGMVVPGGKGIAYVLDSDLAMKTIEKHLKKNKIVALIGEAPRVLSLAHLAHGKKVTCHSSIISNMIKNYKFTGETTTVDDNLITSQSPATAMEFALTIVEKLRDRKSANIIAKEIGYKYKSVIK
ncbi:protein dj-1beta-like isoform X1 [Lycorma delicatula]|uniref:protein dj-1beta-like isoform X1 n=1 Tax=Lycorma delicatula TaxID=130591 RepID=UPI003F515B55